MYGFEIEELWEIPLAMQRLMITIGLLNCVILNPLAIYVLLSRKDSMRLGIRISHLFLHVNHIAQDIFFCFLYQPYPLFPLPIVACMGVLCPHSAVHSLTILCSFLSTSGFALLYLLLRVQQAMQPKPSCGRLSARSRNAVLITAGALLSTATIAFAFHSNEYARKAEVLRTSNVSWISPITRGFVVFGPRAGDFGDQRIGEVYVLLCNSPVVLLIIGLVYSINRTIRKQKIFDSSRGLLLRTWRVVALKVCITTQSTANALVVIVQSMKAKSRQYAALQQFSQPIFSPRWIFQALIDRSSV